MSSKLTPGRMGGLVKTLTSNLHIPAFRELASQLLATYVVRARFTRQQRTGTDWIWVGGRRLLWRPSKKGDIQADADVEVVRHDFSIVGCGSNKYPTLTYSVGASCELVFLSHGLPELDDTHGPWTMHILSLEKLAEPCTVTE